MGLTLNTPDTGGREKLAGIWRQFWKYVVTILHLSHVFMFGWGVRTRGHLLSPVGVETPAQPCNDDGGKNLMCPWCGQTRHVFYTWHGTCVTESNTELMATGLQMKKMCENSTHGGEGSGPGHFPHFFFKIKLFKMHFKPFQAILDHVFFSTFLGGYPREKFKKKSLKWSKMA